MHFKLPTVTFLALVASTLAASAAWDPGGNTPPHATAINKAAGVFEPLEPRADTTRESLVRATGNGGGQ